jgi:hypothetical protein
MDTFPLQWRLYNKNTRNSNLWSIKYNVYADQHRHFTKKTTDSSYVRVYYDFRGATVGDRGSMAWMHAYIAVSNLRSMISMSPTLSPFMYFYILVDEKNVTRSLRLSGRGSSVYKEKKILLILSG